jgi:hypothetical protein
MQCREMIEPQTIEQWTSLACVASYSPILVPENGKHRLILLARDASNSHPVAAIRRVAAQSQKWNACFGHNRSFKRRCQNGLSWVDS